MTRQSRIKLFRLLCICGVVGSLIAWMLPVRAKPYHIKRYLNDWTRRFIVEQVSEIGMDADGFVKVRYSREFASEDTAAIDRIRRDYYDENSPSHKRWPTDGKRLHYDEWGPSNWVRPDGVREVEVGRVYCVPYSITAMASSLPLLWWAGAWLGRKIRVTKFEASNQ